LSLQLRSRAALLNRRGAGDVAAQSIEHSGSDSAGGSDAPQTPPAQRSTDVRRVALVTAYGGLFVGPLGHGWYELLDKVTRRYWAAGSVRCIAAKIVADTVCFGPVRASVMNIAACLRADASALFITLLQVHVASFFGLMGLAAGESRATLETRFREKFWPTCVPALWISRPFCAC
jgi:hypothetical protein